MESVEGLQVLEKDLSGKSQLMLVKFALSTIGAAHLPPQHCVRHSSLQIKFQWIVKGRYHINYILLLPWEEVRNQGQFKWEICLENSAFSGLH